MTDKLEIKEREILVSILALLKTWNREDGTTVNSESWTMWKWYQTHFGQPENGLLRSRTTNKCRNWSARSFITIYGGRGLVLHGDENKLQEIRIKHENIHRWDHFKKELGKFHISGKTQGSEIKRLLFERGRRRKEAYRELVREYCAKGKTQEKKQLVQCCPQLDYGKRK